EGDLNFARDGKMTPGMVGYFPEGASYGPQTSEATAMTIVLQFGGSSGSGYLSRHEVRQGMDELKTFGTFEARGHHPTQTVPGKRNQDAYEAIWPQVNGHPLAYPKPRYPGPIMMDSADFSWVTTGAAGVAEKLLGIFTERRASARFVRLAAEATLEAAGRGI